jgi:hypothetical protein
MTIACKGETHAVSFRPPEVMNIIWHSNHTAHKLCRRRKQTTYLFCQEVGVHEARAVHTDVDVAVTHDLQGHTSWRQL